MAQWEFVPYFMWGHDACVVKDRLYIPGVEGSPKVEREDSGRPVKGLEVGAWIDRERKDTILRVNIEVFPIHGTPFYAILDYVDENKVEFQKIIAEAKTLSELVIAVMEYYQDPSIVSSFVTAMVEYAGNVYKSTEKRIKELLTRSGQT